MASSFLKELHGKVKGTGSAIDIDSLGFRPRMVKLFNATTLATATWIDPMPNASCMEVADAGSNLADVLWVTTNGITPRTYGFTIGTDAILNNSADVIYWSAQE